MTRPKPIAFYLPQFHPVPENDEWWGKGFTEWVNVARARALWTSHYQPHIPLDMGFYDLRLPEVQVEQAALARRYGIYGFCYHYYWFSGRRLLHTPLEIFRAHRDIDIRFCINYANQNWTRRWNGADDDILIHQIHDEQDDRAFIQSLVPFFEDERYIRVDGRPLLLIYRTGLYPDPKRTAEIWREEALRHGMELCLCRVEFGTEAFHPAEIGYDAAVEFPPHHAPGLRPPKTYSPTQLSHVAAGYSGTITDYPDFAAALMSRPLPAYKLFRTAMPGWDNTPRRQLRGDVMVNSTPQAFERWLAVLAQQSLIQHTEKDRFIFINAWNEWGEGAHLEPCRKWRHGYLEAVKRAVDSCEPAAFHSGSETAVPPVVASAGRREPTAEIAGPRVSVVVWADQDPPVLDECMRALAIQTLAPGDFEAIFVDAIDGRDWQPVFDEFMLTHADLDFRYCKIGNGGRAKAVNFGVRNTTADIVIFLSDDFLPAKSLVEAHWRFHQDNPEVHAVGIGGGFFSEDMRSDEFCRWLEDTGELFGVSFTKGTESFPRTYFYLGNSSIKREFLNSAGMFNESFPFPAWDDYEMGIRLAALGMQSKYVPEALTIHYHRVDLPARRIQMRWAGISAFIFELNHGQNPSRDRCAVHWGRHRLRALRKALMFRLTGNARHQQQNWRSLLDAELVRAYGRAKAAFKVDR